MRKITTDELHELFDKLEEDEIIIDVRSPEEYKEGHIPGSKNIPVDDIPKHVDELKEYKKIYLHCKRGGRTMRAYVALEQAELTSPVFVSGGMDEWIEKGYEVL